MSLNIKSFGTSLCEENVASTSEDLAPNANLVEDAIMSNVQFEDQGQSLKMAEVKHENFDYYSAYAAAFPGKARLKRTEAKIARKAASKAQNTSRTQYF